MNEEKIITLETEEGEQILAEVIFTVDIEEKKYVFLTLVKDFENIETIDDEYDVLVYEYDELSDGSIGNLKEIPLTDTETWDKIDEIFATFQDTEFEME